MIIIEDGNLIVYCDCCGEECTEDHEDFEDMQICYKCIEKQQVEG